MIHNHFTCAFVLLSVLDNFFHPNLLFLRALDASESFFFSKMCRDYEAGSETETEREAKSEIKIIKKFENARVREREREGFQMF